MLTKSIGSMQNHELEYLIEAAQKELDSRKAAAECVAAMQQRSAEMNWNRASAALRFDMLDLAGIPATEAEWVNHNWDALPLPYRQVIARAHDEALDYAKPY